MKLLEQFLELLVAIAVFLLHYFAFRSFYPRQDSDLYSNVINICGVAVGFLAAGQALLYSLPDNKVVATLNKLGRLNHLLRFFTAAIVWCMLAAIYTTLSYVVDFKVSPALFSIWLALVSGAVFSTIKVIALFSATIHGA